METRSTSQIFTGCTECEPNEQFCTYYRKQIDDFETERESFEGALRNRLDSHEILHSLEKEVAQAEREVEDLQKSLSDAHVYLFDEREEVMKLTAENDQLEINELENRRKIRELLALTDPKSDMHTDIAKKRASKKKKRSIPKMNPQISSHSSITNGVSTTENDEDTGNLQKSDVQIRTIVLPNESADSLKQVIESLKRQLEEQVSSSREHYSKEIEARRVRDEEWRAKYKTQNETAQHLQKKTAEISQLLNNTTRDYLSLRKLAQLQERSLIERQVACLKENMRLRQKHFLIKKNVQSKSEEVRLEAVSNSEEFIAKFRKQTVTEKAALSRLTKTFAVCQRNFSIKTKKLDTQLQSMRKRHQTLEYRHQLELEGFSNDLRSMQEQTRNLERVMRHIHSNPTKIKTIDDLDSSDIRNIKETDPNITQKVRQVDFVESSILGKLFVYEKVSMG
eukprot:194019_1